MGQFQGTGYVNPHSAKINTLMRPAAAKPALQPAPPVEAAARKVREVVASSTGSVTQTLSNAARQARWRKAHREKHNEIQKARWARRKAEKAHPEQHRDQQRAARARRKTSVSKVEAQS